MAPVLLRGPAGAALRAACLVGLLGLAGWGFPSTAVAADHSVTVQLTADAGQDSYQVGARVDLRVRLGCDGAMPCGPVKLVVDFDQNLAFESYSVAGDRLTDPNHYPDVTAVDAPGQVSFTVGATDPIPGGSYVELPISARGNAIPADGLLSVSATATLGAITRSASLKLAVADGQPPVPALTNLTLRAEPASVAVSLGRTARIRLSAASTGDVAAKPGWSVVVLVPGHVRLVSLTGPGQRCSGNVCTARAGLSPGEVSALTAVVGVDGHVQADARVVAYVRPAEGDVAESVPLGRVPLVTTKAPSTRTDNDAMVRLGIGRNSDRLADTGGRDARGLLTLGLLLVSVGGGLLAPRWRRAAN